MAAVLAVGITAHATDGDVIEFGDFICKVLSEKEKTAVITGYNGQPIGELVLPSSVNKSTGWSYAVTAIGSSAFRNCTGLTSITIPNSVTSIGKEAFQGCTGLTSITIPNSVTAIGTGAFSNCSNLTEILVEEGNTAYTSIEGVLFSNEKTTLVAYPAAKAPDYEIPNSVTAIGDYAFSECVGLTSVTIPNSVTAIGDYAFYCSGLTSITIPNSVTAIGTAAFSNCSGLTSVTIPNSVTAIGNYAFYRCIGLTSITIPNSVTAIGRSAFANCTGLTSITIPNSVTAISDHAFSNCSGLTSVTIPNSVTTISMSTFANCTGLTSITIPNSVTAISEYAFSNCTAVNTIYCYAINPPISGSSNSVFQAVDISKVVLHVVKGADAAYQEADPWKDFIILADLEAQSGIKGIEADGSNAPAEFFNLNGVRVANPENGLYIKRQGGKTAKVLVK
ncbi:MAG: leucine-rich repeat domain-containing protein [Muribaculaceae bacterium]|nr:leucine-rich repeat domain-containing protein [Muribaculaceae bacterium]